MSFKPFYKKKPHIFHLYVYGCDAHVVDYKAKAKEKMISYLWAGILVDYKAKN